MFSRAQVIQGDWRKITDVKTESDSIEDLLTEDDTENNQENRWHHFASHNDLLEDDKERIYSYFVHRDQLKDVVACPGVILPSLQNSCYVPIEEILGPLLEDDEDEILQEQSEPILTKKLTKPNNRESN